MTESSEACSGKESMVVEPETTLKMARESTDQWPMGASDLHDATLVDIEVDWEDGTCLLNFRTQERPNCALLFSGFSNIAVPRQLSWGMSSSVLAVKNTNNVYEVEMQSGDTIRVEALSCRFPSQ